MTKTLHRPDTFVKLARPLYAIVTGGESRKDWPMRIVSISVILVGVFASGWSSVLAGQATEQRPVSAAGRSGAVESTEASRIASRIIGTYCAGCHNGVMRSPSGALLDRFDTARIVRKP